MTEPKIEKIQLQFKTLTAAAVSLNTASDELTKTVAILDEALKKLNIGLTVWESFRYRNDDQEPEVYDEDQIGYVKIKGTWGIALRRIWGDHVADRHDGDGPWLFNDAPRELRLHGVDYIPKLIESLTKEAFDTANKIQKKASEVRELAGAIENIATLPPGKPAGKLSFSNVPLTPPGKLTGKLSDMNPKPEGK